MYNICKEGVYFIIIRQFVVVFIIFSIFCVSEEIKFGYKFSKKIIVDINYFCLQIFEIKKYIVSFISWDSYIIKKYFISIYLVIWYVIYMKLKYIVKFCRRSYIYQYMYL